MRQNRWKTLGIDMLYDLAGAFLQAVGVWCFIEPCRIAPGGASGLALLLNVFTGIPVGTMTFLINIPLLAASYLVLNRSMTWKTVRTVAWMAVVQDGFVAQVFPQYIGDRLMQAGFGGILVGLGMTLIFMRNSTTGGGDILAKLLQKRFPYMQTGFALMLVDFCIIGVSALVFREIESVLYGIISMVCTTQTIDVVLYGMNKGSMITIHSPKNREIAEEIMATMDRGTTLYKTVGGFSKQEGETLMCVVDRKQFYLVKAIIDKHDPKAFTIVSPTKEVYGEGFLNDHRKAAPEP